MAVLAPAARADCGASYAALRPTLDKAGVTEAQFLATCLPPTSGKTGTPLGTPPGPDSGSAAAIILSGPNPRDTFALPFVSYAS